MLITFSKVENKQIGLNVIRILEYATTVLFNVEQDDDGGDRVICRERAR
jgi:hypothetical protein